MTGRLSILSLCAFFSLPVSAGFVEVAQWIPWNFVSQELRKTEISYSMLREDLPLSLGEFRPRLRNVSFHLNGAMDDVSFGGGKLSVSGQGSLVLTVDSVTVDQVITREIGGNVFQVHVRAECDPIRIEVRQFTLNNYFDIHSGLPVLQDIALGIPSWSVSPVTCSGISHLSQEIAEKIQLFLSAPDSLAPVMKEWAAPALKDWLRSQWPPALNTLSYDETGLIIPARLPLSGSEEVFLPTILPEQLKTDHPRLFLSYEGMTAILKDRLKEKIPPYYDLRSLESFRKLMGSRLLQFLVWPELRRYHSSAPFVLRTDPSSLSLTMEKNKELWNASVRGSGSLVTVISGAPIDYLLTNLNLTVPLTVKLVSGKLFIRTGKSPASVDFKVSPLYRMLYSPDEKVPASLISNAVSGMVSGKEEIVELPSVTFGNQELRLTNLQFHQQLITMDWQ